MQKSEGKTGTFDKGERQFVQRALDACNLLMSVGYEPKEVDPDAAAVEQHKQTIVNVVLGAVAELDETARAIIWKRCLPLEPVQDNAVMVELGMKRGRYFATKHAAFARLAELLRAAQRGEQGDGSGTEGAASAHPRTA